MALEDAALLGAVLRDSGVTAQALSAWAAARLPRLQGVHGEHDKMIRPLRKVTRQGCQPASDGTLRVVTCNGKAPNDM